MRSNCGVRGVRIRIEKYLDLETIEYDICCWNLFFAKILNMVIPPPPPEPSEGGGFGLFSNIFQNRQNPQKSGFRREDGGYALGEFYD